MTWAQRLKRVCAIDIEKCEKCGGPVRIIFKHIGYATVTVAFGRCLNSIPDSPQFRSTHTRLEQPRGLQANRRNYVLFLEREKGGYSSWPPQPPT